MRCERGCLAWDVVLVESGGELAAHGDANPHHQDCLVLPCLSHFNRQNETKAEIGHMSQAPEEITGQCK